MVSNVERRAAGFCFVKRRGSALCVLVSEGFGFKIILGKSIWFVKGEYIYLIKRNKLDLKIKNL